MREATTCMQAAVEAYEKVGESYWLPKARQRLADMNVELSQMQ